jgi:hypothetical protein
MEPITILHGLLNHTMCRLPIAMCILGYVNHSTPAHLPSDSELDAEFNAPADLPKGTVRIQDTLRCPKDVSWSTLVLYKTHMQIHFIPEESGFLRLQNHSFQWNLSYNGKIHPVVFHPYVPFIIGDTEGHNRLCGHFSAQFSQIQQLCRIYECPTYLSGYSKSNFHHRVPKNMDALVRKGHISDLQLSQNYLLPNVYSSIESLGSSPLAVLASSCQ